MRTTIYLPDEVIAQAKRIAATTRRTLTSVIEDALRESFARRRRRGSRDRLQLTTFGAGGLQPGVDLDDSAALLEVMDSNRATDGR